jgi:putative alpha-1,2-mannosidase
MGWDASSGYHYDDRQIYAFSHTHLSGTGIGDLAMWLYFPSREAIPSNP